MVSCINGQQVTGQAPLGQQEEGGCGGLIKQSMWVWSSDQALHVGVVV